MYLEFYGLEEPPFSITPDPRFVYLSERHRDALAHLLYGIGQGGGGGFVQLTGEVGTGKTTLSRSEEHTSELQSLMRISYAVFCLKKKKTKITKSYTLLTEYLIATSVT